MKRVGTDTREMGRDFAGTFGTSLVRLVLSGVTSILLARMLGPRARGEFALILLWSGVFATIAMVGTNEAVSYYASVEPGNANRHLRTGIRRCIRLLAVTVPLAMFLMGFLLRTTSELARTLAVALVPLYLPVNVLYSLTLGFLQGQRRFGSLNRLLMMNDAVYCVLAVGAFLSQKAGAPLMFAVGAFAASSLATGLVALRILACAGQFAAFAELGVAAGSGVVGRYGRSVAPASWIMLLSARLDEMACSQMLPVHALGIYSVAKTTIVGITAVPLSLSLVLLPRVVDAHRAGVLRSLLKSSALFTACCLLAVLIPSLLLMPLLLPLVFGKQFAEGVLTARLLLIAAAFGGMAEVAITTLKGTNQLRLALACRVAVVVLLFVTLLVLAGPLGLAGVATSCLVAGMAGAIGTWTVVARTAGRVGPATRFSVAKEVLSA